MTATKGGDERRSGNQDGEERGAGKVSAARLQPRAPVALALNALYGAAGALCGIFLSVYLWINSRDFEVVCQFYLALYVVTPGVFVLAGWYSQARDRLHVYRVGLVLSAVFYSALLLLRERSPDYALALGALQGVTWGTYWAGVHTLNYDVTALGKREYYFGLVQGLTGLVGLAAPLVSGVIIHFSADTGQGYHRIFAVAVGLYLACCALSFWMPPDKERRPFRIRRALFPGKDQRDWRLVMAASGTLAGTFSIFAFLLGLLMYMETGDELTVGGYASLQALAAVAVSFFVGRAVTPRTRRKFMRWGVIALAAAGGLMAFELTIVTLFLFGLLRSVSAPLFAIPHAGLRYDIIGRSAEEPGQRIEYLCAWEVPLAVGRVIMMLLMMILSGVLRESDVGLRIALFVLCGIRVITYQLLVRTSPMARPERG